MKREIIKQMIQIAGSERADDLSYDIAVLKDYEEQFVWSISGTTCTALQLCSKEIIKFQLNTESGRYRYARDGHRLWICDHDDSKYYWCGAKGSNQLIEITRTQAENWSGMQYEEALQEWKADGNEFPTRLIVGELKINCPATYLEEQLQYAKKHNDNSLDNILKRLSDRPRCADNHYIHIDKDFAERSFIFTEFINGKVEMRGGIIFHGYPDEGYKENCSVQLTPLYGWQVHT